MRVWRPFYYVSETGHRVRVGEGEHGNLPDAAVVEGRRAGAFEQPQVKAYAGAPTNKGKRGRRRVSA